MLFKFRPLVTSNTEVVEQVFQFKRGNCVNLATLALKGPKRKPLEREYPDLCKKLKPLQVDRPGFCRNNNWDLRYRVTSCPNST